MGKIFSEDIPFPIAVSHSVTFNKSEKLIHIHENAYELLLFVAGDVNYFFETSIYSTKPGDVLLVPPNMIHGYTIKSDEAYERYPIHVYPHLLDSLSTPDTSLLEAFSDPEHHIVHLNEEELAEYRYHAEAMIRARKENAYGHDIVCRAHLLFLLLIINTAYRNAYSSAKDVDISPKVIRDTIDYINLHLTEDITVQKISDDLGISNSRLSHLFKEHTGSSIWHYVVAKRLMHARSLLLEGKNVMEACYESGFRDYSHFNKAFSKSFHVSPGKFLKEIASQ